MDRKKEPIRISLYPETIKALTDMAGSERKRGDFIANLIEAEAQRRKQQKMGEGLEPIQLGTDYNDLDWPDRIEAKIDKLLSNTTIASR